MDVQELLFGDRNDPREQRVKTLIERCGYACAALTILPIPGTEILGVMPLHVGMVVGIGHEYGKKITRDSATELILRIGATVGLSLVGSRLAMTAGKIILPGFGGLVAAPFMYASTLAIGTVARHYFEADGDLDDSKMKQVYDAAMDHAKATFDPTRARSSEAKDMAEAAAREAADEEPPRGPASVDELAERLAVVDELHEAGHISDDEHARRRQQILDEI
jgi:uncharacterized protein (DUF697 family)